MNCPTVHRLIDRCNLGRRRSARGGLPPRLWGCLLVGLPLLISATGCLHTPVTGRAQLNALSEAQERQLGEESWRQILAEQPLSTDAESIAIVERVGQRIAAASGRTDYDWEFKVIKSPQRNAFALPGGKVAVYEGLLPYCENEAGLAVVMSHEVAHVLARHSGERMTQEGAAEVSKGILRRATSDRSPADQDRWLGAFGVASRYGVLLPYSRHHEAEADSIGLTLMAKAGYDPREAPRFWQRFSAAKSAQTPELLSTHPSDASRTQNLNRLLPQAVAIYDGAQHRYGTGVAIAPVPSNAQTSQATEDIRLVEFEAVTESAPSTSFDGGVVPANYTSESAADFPPVNSLGAHVAGPSTPVTEVIGFAPIQTASVPVTDILPPIERRRVATGVDMTPTSPAEMPAIAPNVNSPAPAAFPTGIEAHRLPTREELPAEPTLEQSPLPQIANDGWHPRGE
ncbi:MAG: M48 family metalloprotease [Planctomycetaceae bacterium]